MKYLDVWRQRQEQRGKERRFREWKSQLGRLAGPDLAVDGIGAFVVFDDRQSFGPFRPKSVSITDNVIMLFECGITHAGRVIGANVMWAGQVRWMSLPPARVAPGDILSIHYTATMHTQ